MGRKSLSLRDLIAHSIFRALNESPSLIEGLPEASAFANGSLEFPSSTFDLNLNQKLGHLYEDAAAAMIESTSRYDLLARSLQIRNHAGRTLGEIDFLLRDYQSTHLIHLELAIKFYLAVADGDSHLMPGPDARDNYYRKLEKMRSHQLSMAEKHRNLLPPEFQTADIKPQHLVQGCLFEHIHSQCLVRADFLNPDGNRGKWLHVHECHEYFGSTAQLRVIPKPLWPVPLEILSKLRLEPWQFNPLIERCIMITDSNSEIPYFIAPSNYPEMDQL